MSFGASGPALSSSPIRSAMTWWFQLRAGGPSQSSDRYSKARINSSRVVTAAGLTGHGPSSARRRSCSSSVPWLRNKTFQAMTPMTPRTNPVRSPCQPLVSRLFVAAVGLFPEKLPRTRAESSCARCQCGKAGGVRLRGQDMPSLGSRRSR